MYIYIYGQGGETGIHTHFELYAKYIYIYIFIRFNQFTKIMG